MKLGRTGRLGLGLEKEMSGRNRILAWAFLCLGFFLCLATVAPAQDRSTQGLLSESGPTFTIPAPEGPWTLIAYGDTRFTDPTDIIDTSPTVRRKLIEKIAEEKPAVLLISGDVPFHGGVAKDYAVFRKETAVWRRENIRVFPALGNHELAGKFYPRQCGDCMRNWWNTFPKLRGRRWYSVRFGEAYILTLDSNLELMPGSLQGEWLRKQLEELPKEIRYVFVSLHHPPIADPILNDPSHNARPNEAALAKAVEAAAQAHGNVSFVVIAGHIHNYERFEHGGVEYLVAGGGGARPYPIARTPQDLYQDNVFPNYHYVKFVCQGGTLKATMYRLDEKGGFVAADSFEMGKAASATAR